MTMGEITNSAFTLGLLMLMAYNSGLDAVSTTPASGATTATRDATTPVSDNPIYATEASQNEVTVVFYMLSQSAFAEKRETFRQTMAEAATSHCKTDHASCGLPANWHQTQTFSVTDVEISSENDGLEKARLHVKYFVSLPRALTSSKTAYILNKDAVSYSVSSAKDRFYQAMGASVIQAGVITLSPIPDVTVNAIMISIGLLLTLALMGIVIGFEMYAHRQEKKRQEAMMAARGYSSNPYWRKQHRDSQRNIKIEQYKKTHPLKQPRTDDDKLSISGAHRDPHTNYPKPHQSQQPAPEIYRPVKEGYNSRPADGFYDNSLRLSEDPSPRQTESYIKPQYSSTINSKPPSGPSLNPPTYHSNTDYTQNGLRNYDDFDNRSANAPSPYAFRNRSRDDVTTEPHVTTMHVSSYGNHDIGGDTYRLDVTDAVRAGALTPLNAEELKRQRRREKKAARKARMEEEGDPSEAPSSVKSVGYENGSYDNGGERRARRGRDDEPSREYSEPSRNYNIQLKSKSDNASYSDNMSIDDQEAKRSKSSGSLEAHWRNNRDVASQDSGLNSTIGQRLNTGTSGFYRSTDV